MQIVAVHKLTKAPLVFESETADSETLDSVENPEGLPPDQKRAFFVRKQKLAIAITKAAQMTILKKHRDRLRAILLDLWARALGPKDDTVHLQIKATALKLTSVLQTYKGYALDSDKRFKEATLIQDLRAALVVLKGSVPDLAATAEHIAGLEKARRQVGDVLARAEAGIRAWVKDASIGYRGSLATGWRNENKSEDGKAQRINLLKFDSDAFVTIPHDTWVAWSDLGVVLENKVNDKMALSELMLRARMKSEDPGKESALERLRAQLAGIHKVEEQLCDAMKSVSGYKMTDDGTADFSFVLQTSKKTVRELTAGNLYPLDQIAKAGLPLTELDLDVVVDDGVFKVKMPERHVSMSKIIGGKTYSSDPDPVPHTVVRPTERMAIEAYFALPDPVPLHHVVPVTRDLMATIAALSVSSALTIEAIEWE